MRIEPAASGPPAGDQALMPAATGFEALLIRQLLAYARPAGTNGEWAALAESQAADLLATCGPLGVAGLLAGAGK
jgi:hypothetical protein